MSLYIIEDDDGNVLTNYGDFDNTMVRAALYDGPLEPAVDIERYGGHLVTLIEEQKVKLPREVGEELDEYKRGFEHDIDVLDLLTDVDDLSELLKTHKWLYNSDGDRSEHANRLIDAYRYGWEVEKPKRYVLPMPGTDYHNNMMRRNAQYYAVKGTGVHWRPDVIALGTSDAVKHGYTVTQSDIDSAPDWVKTITPVEVTDDEQ